MPAAPRLPALTGENYMSWLNFYDLIEKKNCSPQSWKAAAAGNPNNPHSALQLALRKTLSPDLPYDQLIRNYNNVATIILALVDAQNGKSAQR